MAKLTSTPDFTSSNQGSIIMLLPLTGKAADWLDANCDGETAIEHNCFFDIACELLDDGLTLQDAATGRFAELPS